MARELLLALDLGTTGVCALALAPEGRVRGRAYRPLPVAFPAPGRVEQDPEALVARAREALAAALAEAGAEPGAVAALGIATQRATALAWDARTGEALAPALGWQDQRVARGLARLRAEGIPLGTQPSLAKFLWWLEEDPAVQSAAREGRLRLGTPDAWLGQRLAGAAGAVTEPGQAGCTALYDPNAGDWADGFLAKLGLERAWLPEIVASAGVCGEVGVEGLRGIPLAARAGDQQASAFAAGLRHAGEAKLTLGTAAMVDLHVGATPAAPRGGTIPLPLWRLPDGTESHCLEGHVTTAGAALAWCAGLGLADDVPALERLAASADDDGGMVAVPALQGLGTPWSCDEARGLVGGLTRGSSAAQLARALFEGVAQRCVDVWETLAPEDPVIRADGGLSRSALLLQRLADLSGRPVRAAAEAEGTAVGAAALAALGAGLDAAPITAPPDAHAGRVYEPAIGGDARAALRDRWRRVVQERVAAPAAAAAEAAA